MNEESGMFLGNMAKNIKIVLFVEPFEEEREKKHRKTRPKKAKKWHLLRKERCHFL